MTHFLAILGIAGYLPVEFKRFPTHEIQHEAWLEEWHRYAFDTQVPIYTSEIIYVISVCCWVRFSVSHASTRRASRPVVTSNTTGATLNRLSQRLITTSAPLLLLQVQYQCQQPV